MRAALLWLRRYNAAIQLEAAQKLLAVEHALGASTEHILNAQARVNMRLRHQLHLMEKR